MGGGCGHGYSGGGCYGSYYSDYGFDDDCYSNNFSDCFRRYRDCYSDKCSSRGRGRFGGILG